MKKTKLFKLTLVCLLPSLTACVSTVQPWEREHFAKSEMTWEPDSMQAAFKRHVYTSKEATTGGDSTAGGGCGCN